MAVVYQTKILEAWQKSWWGKSKLGKKAENGAEICRGGRFYTH